MRAAFHLSALSDLIVARIRGSGPITVAEYMELALYHPEHGYYSSAAQRSGRGGDFFTSVDVGALFGEILAVQLDEMWTVLREAGATHFDFVEAAAGNARLAHDILEAASQNHEDLYAHLRVTLVEPSAHARAAQGQTIGGRHRSKIRASMTALPSEVTGVIFANELLDAMPVHVVTPAGDHLQEVYVDERDGTLIETPGPPSTAAISDYFDRLGVQPAAGARVEVGLGAVEWIRTAAAALDRGFLVLIDYGRRAGELCASHANGTLTSYRAHTADANWLADPGGRDLTAQVNLTAIERAARAAGLDVLGMVDQTYFLTALGLVERLDAGSAPASVRRRLAAKTLIEPAGLGGTMKVLIFARRVGHPALAGLSSGRLT